MNVKLLRRIQREIKKEPRRFNMRTWLDRYDATSPCGTTACIAGWAVVLTKLRLPITPERLKRTAKSIMEEEGFVRIDRNAGDELDLTSLEASKLFYLGNWPGQFLDAYKSADSIAEQANVASARIDHFIETGGAQ